MPPAASHISMRWTRNLIGLQAVISRTTARVACFRANGAVARAIHSSRLFLCVATEFGSMHGPKNLDVSMILFIGSAMLLLRNAEIPHASKNPVCEPVRY